MPGRQHLIEESAYSFEQTYGGCAQAVLAGFKENSTVVSDGLFRAGTGLAGGVGLMGSVCGALLGGILVLGSIGGRSFDSLDGSKQASRRTMEMVEELCNAFKTEYGSIYCSDIQKCLMGDSFDLKNQNEKEKFLEKGGRSDKCPSVCRNAARWVYEALDRRELEI